MIPGGVTFTDPAGRPALSFLSTATALNTRPVFPRREVIDVQLRYELKRHQQAQRQARFAQLRNQIGGGRPGEAEEQRDIPVRPSG